MAFQDDDDMMSFNGRMIIDLYVDLKRGKRMQKIQKDTKRIKKGKWSEPEQHRQYDNGSDEGIDQRSQDRLTQAFGSISS